MSRQTLQRQYRYVHFYSGRNEKNLNPWLGRICHASHGQSYNYNTNYCATEEEAARAVDRYLYKVHGSDETNFPLTAQQMTELDGLTLDQIEAQFRAAGTVFSRGECQYRGVSRKGRAYRAKVLVHGRALNFLSTTTQPDAAKVYDAATVILRGRSALINFPAEWSSLGEEEARAQAKERLGPVHWAKLQQALANGGKQTTKKAPKKVFDGPPEQCHAKRTIAPTNHATGPETGTQDSVLAAESDAGSAEADDLGSDITSAYESDSQWSAPEWECSNDWYGWNDDDNIMQLGAELSLPELDEVEQAANRLTAAYEADIQQVVREPEGQPARKKPRCEDHACEVLLKAMQLSVESVDVCTNKNCEATPAISAEKTAVVAEQQGPDADNILSHEDEDYIRHVSSGGKPIHPGLFQSTYFLHEELPSMQAIQTMVCRAAAGQYVPPADYEWLKDVPLDRPGPGLRPADAPDHDDHPCYRLYRLCKTPMLLPGQTLSRAAQAGKGKDIQLKGPSAQYLYHEDYNDLCARVNQDELMAEFRYQEEKATEIIAAGMDYEGEGDFVKLYRPFEGNIGAPSSSDASHATPAFKSTHLMSEEELRDPNYKASQSQSILNAAITAAVRAVKEYKHDDPRLDPTSPIYSNVASIPVISSCAIEPYNVCRIAFVRAFISLYLRNADELYTELLVPPHVARKQQQALLERLQAAVETEKARQPVFLAKCAALKAQHEQLQAMQYEQLFNSSDMHVGTIQHTAAMVSSATPQDNPSNPNNPGSIPVASNTETAQLAAAPGAKCLMGTSSAATSLADASTDMLIEAPTYAATSAPAVTGPIMTAEDVLKALCADINMGMFSHNMNATGNVTSTGIMPVIGQSSAMVKQSIGTATAATTTTLGLDYDTATACNLLETMPATTTIADKAGTSAVTLTSDTAAAGRVAANSTFSNAFNTAPVPGSPLRVTQVKMSAEELQAWCDTVRNEIKANPDTVLRIDCDFGFDKK